MHTPAADGSYTGKTFNQVLSNGCRLQHSLVSYVLAGNHNLWGYWYILMVYGLSWYPKNKRDLIGDFQMCQHLLHWSSWLTGWRTENFTETVDWPFLMFNSSVTICLLFYTWEWYAWSVWSVHSRLTVWSPQSVSPDSLNHWLIKTGFEPL